MLFSVITDAYLSWLAIASLIMALMKSSCSTTAAVFSPAESRVVVIISVLETAQRNANNNTLITITC